MTGPNIAAALLTAAGLATAFYVAVDPMLPEAPNDRLTPGMVASTDIREVCAADGKSGSAYARAHRQTGYADKLYVAEKYSLPKSRWHEVQFDHRVPLCLGGADDVANLWPQNRTAAKRKDELEVYACREACAGRIGLGEAQMWFMPPTDWRDIYRQRLAR